MTDKKPTEEEERKIDSFRIQVNFWEEHIWKVHAIFTVLSIAILYYASTENLSPEIIPGFMLSFGLIISLYCLTAINIMDNKRLDNLDKIKDVQNDKPNYRISIGLWGEIILTTILIVGYFISFLYTMGEEFFFIPIVIIFLWIMILLIKSYIDYNKNIYNAYLKQIREKTK